VTANRESSPLLAAKPDRGATFVRLLVETNEPGGRVERSLRQVVDATLGVDATGRPWKVERLFAPGGDCPENLERFFTVTGNVSSVYPLSKLAFELSYRLRAAGNYATIQPDLPSSYYDPVHSPAGDPDFVIRSGGDAPHLPGSASKAWAREAIRCAEAWKLPLPPNGASRGAGIVLGHPDTGYADHPQLVPDALDLSRDFDILNDDDDARDPLEKPLFGLGNPGHGTGTGSVLVNRAGRTIVGVAPQATLVPIRTITSVVVIFAGDVARAVDYARRSGCHVVSMSLGGLPYSGLQLAIQEAVRDGMIVAAAAGNYVGTVVWPALYPECIAVAGSNVDDRPWSGSSHGESVLVSAPAESVWSASFNLDVAPSKPTVGRHHGTSFAVAHLAGVACLWLAYHGRGALLARYGSSRLRNAFCHLVRTVGHRRPPGWDTHEYGAGIVDAAALLSAGLPPHDDIPEATVVAGPQAADRVALIQAVCPELAPDEVGGRLEALFAPSMPTAAAVGAAIEQYGFELLYLLTEHPYLREAFVRYGDLRAAEGPVGASPAGLAPLAALRAAASPSMGRALNQGR
jgi:hypothetical protein